MTTQLQALQLEVNKIQDFLDKLDAASTIPKPVQDAFKARLGIVAIQKVIDDLSSVDGVIIGDGEGGFTSITPLTGTHVYYVSDSSGGAVTRKLTFNEGILISQT